MLKNELEYEVTKEHKHNFEQALAALERDEEKKKKEPIVWQLHHDGVESMLSEFAEEIAEYEMLTAHDRQTPLVLKLDDPNYLPQILIKARMGAKLSQKELADLSGLTEEQICSYEAKNYHTASVLDLFAVIDALDLKIKTCEFLVPLDTLRRESPPGFLTPAG
ncbi:MAG: helix-turn-helix transcriptional regulator [Hormoscilla sp. GM7CHS1pb]|nr:helix-turn-helix transcriptional regulator [Hormoscilla sp. GM7CHS1pb]